MKEFELINKYFRPLSKYQVSYNLKDDAAVFKEDLPIVQTTDNLIENIHFFSDDSPENIINRSMAVNLSDIASMGAIPKYYTLCLSIPKKEKFNDNWFSKFSSQLEIIQNKYNISIIGGNTAFYKGPLNVNINMIGTLPTNNVKPLLQSNAKPGDSIYISNTVGDAYFGLKYLQNKQGFLKYFKIFSKSKMNKYVLSKNDLDFLNKAFYDPKPQIYLGQILLKYANSCTDISDGLLQDLKKICRHSNVVGKINLEDFQFSNPVIKIINRENNKNKIKTIFNAISNGDDYQLVFTVDENKEKELLFECQRYNIFIQKIGKILKQKTNNPSLNIYYNNECINSKFVSRGYEHKSR